MSPYILFSLKFQDKTMNRNQCVCGGVTNIQMNAVVDIHLFEINP